MEGDGLREVDHPHAWRVRDDDRRGPLDVPDGLHRAVVRRRIGRPDGPVTDLALIEDQYVQGGTYRRWAADLGDVAGIPFASSNHSLTDRLRLVVLTDPQSKLVSSGDANAARSALAAFDKGAADLSNLEATRRTGDLFLEKYNAPDARLSYESVLKRAPDDAEALLGLAQVEEFEGKPSALATARRALAANPKLSGAHAFVARLQLEAEAWDSATVSARLALAADSANIAAWSVLGATAWLRGDSAAFRAARTAATAIQPQPAEFYANLAEAAVRQRRYAEAAINF